MTSTEPKDKNDASVLTGLSLSATTFPIEMIFRFSLPIQISSQNTTTSQLDLIQWQQVFLNCSILYGIRMDKETLKYANRAILKFGDSKKSIPRFTANDESYIKAQLGNKLMESPFRPNHFFDGGLGDSCPFIRYGVHPEWLKNHTISDEERIIYSTCSYNDPRVTVTFDLSYLEITSQFIQDIDDVIQLPVEKQKAGLKEVLSTYGHVYPERVILGGYLYYIRSHLIRKEDVNTMLKSANESFHTSFETFLKISTNSNDMAAESVKEMEEYKSANIFQFIGGDRSLSRNVQAWKKSLDDPLQWRVVEYERFRSVISLLSQDRQDAIRKIIEHGSIQKKGKLMM